MTEPIDVMAELDRVGAVLLHRHFVYKSAKHGSGYINMDPMFPDVVMVYEFCAEMLAPFRHQIHNLQVDTIAAPAAGGIVLANFCALYCYQHWGVRVKAVWADKDGDDFVFERDGFVKELTGKRVLLVEDLATTGGSVAKVARQAEKHGATIVGAALICNRGGVTADDLRVPRLEQVTSVDFEALAAESCPLCRDAVPIIEDIGHAAAFKARHPDYAGGYTKLHDS